MGRISRLSVAALLFAGIVSIAQAEPVRVVMKTNQGEITLELDGDKAPKSVGNFLRYAREGFYENTLFHRVIEGFMIQGGGYTPEFDRKPGHEPIENEADNGLKNLRGTIAMARTNHPHSATSQFFINHADNPNLDHRDQTLRGWGYAVFGKVVDGIDVVDRIAQQPTGSNDMGMQNVPLSPVVIERVDILAQ